MKFAMIKIVALAVFAFANTNGVYASSLDDGMDRHNNAPPPHHAAPMVEDNGRSSGISEAPRCVSDSDGRFGDPSANGVTLKYYYEIEYDTRVIPRVTNRVLKTIQNQISDYLLPVLFQRACSDTRRKLAETLRRRLEAVGISALPDDVIVQGASCSYEPSGGDFVSCSLAFGQASIFAQEGASAEHQGDRAIESIELIMNDKGLDGIAPGVRKVSYVNGTHVKGVDPSVVGGPSAAQNTSSNASDTDEGLPGYAIALIIVAVVGVVVVGLFLVVRKRQQRARQRREMANPGALAFEELSLDGRSSAI